MREIEREGDRERGRDGGGRAVSHVYRQALMHDDKVAHTDGGRSDGEAEKHRHIETRMTRDI